MQRSIVSALLVTISLTASLACVPGLLTACGGPRPSGGSGVVAVSNVDGGRPLPPPRAACDLDPAAAEIDAEHVTGTKIVAICLTGGSPETRAAIEKVLKLGPGKTLTTDALRADLAAAYSEGLVRQVEASARASESGAVLVLAIEERPRLSAISVDGLVALRNDEAALALPKQGDALDPGALFATMRRLKEHYLAEGWDDAALNLSVDPEPGASVPARARVRITVVEGARSKLGKVSFDGARDGRDGGLRKAVELEEGAPISEALVERAALLINAFYYENGFMNVQVATPVRDRAKDGTVRVSFKITEGPVFKIGKIRATKAGAALEKEMLAKVTTKPGEVFRRSKLQADLAAVRAMFEARGEKVDVDPSTELDPKKGLVDIDLVLTKR